MKRFEFRLAAVLRLKDAQLESEKAALNQLQAEEQQRSAELHTIAAERLQAKTFVHDLSDFGITELRGVSSFLLGMDARAGILRQQLVEAVVAVKNQRKRVTEADRIVRLLTKLREKKLAEWNREVAHDIEACAQESWLAFRHLRSRPAQSNRCTAGLLPSGRDGKLEGKLS
jgi:flagellar protein FliJ